MLTSLVGQTYNLPDPLSDWPWEDPVNEHYEEAKAESASWVKSFAYLSPEAEVEFERAEFGKSMSVSRWRTSSTYPQGNRYRSACCVYVDENQFL